MSDGTSGRYRAGETALLAVVGEAEPVVGPWRQRFDSFASAGVPTPAEPFRALTEAVVARWPEAPPYGGQFAEVVPHLTVAHGRQGHVLDEVEAALTARLPVSADVTSVSLFVSDGDRWHRRAAFPLLGARHDAMGA